MSQEQNVDVMRESFEAFNLGGFEAALAFYSPDFVFYAHPEWPDDAEYRGHDDARRAFAMLTDTFEDYVWEAKEIRAMEDRVVVLMYIEGRIKDSGVQIREKRGIVASDFHDGMIGELRILPTWEQALKAVGLSG